jgi:cell wall assembly regulator SMI1
LPGGELLSLEGIFKQWAIWRDLLESGDFEGNQSDPSGPIKRDWWNLRWIPFTHNGGGDHYCLDLDPPADGVVGQVIDFGHETGPIRVLAPSLREYLEWYAGALESGRIRFNSAGDVEQGK